MVKSETELLWQRLVDDTLQKHLQKVQTEKRLEVILENIKGLVIKECLNSSISSESLRKIEQWKREKEEEERRMRAL